MSCRRPQYKCSLKMLLIKHKATEWYKSSVCLSCQVIWAFDINFCLNLKKAWRWTQKTRWQLSSSVLYFTFRITVWISFFFLFLKKNYLYSVIQVIKQHETGNNTSVKQGWKTKIHNNTRQEGMLDSNMSKYATITITK